MELKITKGEWTVDACGWVVGGDGFLVCEIDSTTDHDAHLIAVAPDLYAMIEMLIDGDSINDSSIEKEAIKLLKKARGE